MDFAFTPEQEELRAQARAYLATNGERVLGGLAALWVDPGFCARPTAAPGSGFWRKRFSSRKWGVL